MCNGLLNIALLTYNSTKLEIHDAVCSPPDLGKFVNGA